MRKLIFLFALISTFVLGQTPNGSRKAWADTLRVSYNNQFIDILDLSRDSLHVAEDTTALKAYPGKGGVYLKQLSSSNANGGGMFVYADSTLPDSIYGGGVQYDTPVAGKKWVIAELANREVDYLRPEWFGANPTDTNSDSAALQKTLKALKYGHTYRTPKIMQLSPGWYYTPTCTLYNQTGIIGAGNSSTNGSTDWKGASAIVRTNNSNKDLIVVADAGGHHITIEDVTLIGNKANNTSGNGIRFRNAPGEGTIIRNVVAIRHPENGIKLDGGTVPFRMENNTLFFNDSSGVLLEVDNPLEVIAGAFLYNTSGDDNGKSLITVRRKAGNVYGILISGVKEEANTTGLQQNGITLDNLNNSAVLVTGMISSPNVAQNASILVRGATGTKLDWLAVEGAIDDSVSGLRVENTESGGNNHSGKNYIEVNRRGLRFSPETFTANDATPLITGSYHKTANTSNTTISDFDGIFQDGFFLNVFVNDRYTLFSAGSFININADHTIHPDSGSVLQFVSNSNGTRWQQVGDWSLIGQGQIDSGEIADTVVHYSIEASSRAFVSFRSTAPDTLHFVRVVNDTLFVSLKGGVAASNRAYNWEIK